MKRPLFFFSAGEPSGDLHAAGLIQELKKQFPDAGFVGFGGPEMEKAGCRLEADLTKFAVMWFSRVLYNIRTFAGYLKSARAFFKSEKPDMLILVDYPGFNWHLAKYAKRLGIPVCWYMPPQIWAWAQGRVRKMKKYADFVISPLSFEQKWFRSHQIDTEAITHPFFDEMKAKTYDRGFMESLAGDKSRITTQPSPSFLPEPIPERPILTVLPGSRRQEISGNLPDMLHTVRRVQEAVPGIRPLIAAFKEEQVPLIREIVSDEKMEIPVFVGRTRELIALSTCDLAVSGSVSMELLAMAKPTVIYYRVGRLAHWLSRRFRRVKYITLVNLLAADAVEGESIFYETSVAPASPTQRQWGLMLFPEFLTGKDRSKEAALPLVKWLTDPESLVDQRNALASLYRRESGTESSFKRAAQIITDRLNRANVAQ